MKQGTSRKERALSALNPSSFKLDSRSLTDIYEDTKTFAKTIVFEESGASYTWEALFEEGATYLETAEESSFDQLSYKACPPHIALFFSFVKLLLTVQEQYNTLTKEHLLFFYKRVLGQSSYPMTGDKVFLFMELARNVDKFHLDEGAEFLAGRDSNKNSIIYNAEREAFINKAKVVQFNAIYTSKKVGESIYSYRNLPELQSQFENAEGVDENVQSAGWFPFGSPKLQKISAQMGFGVQAAILHLAEGERIIEVAITIGDHETQLLKNRLLSPTIWEVHLETEEGILVKPLSGFNLDKDQLIFEIKLGKLDPPLVVLVAKAPCLKFVLAGGFSHDLYALLQQIKVHEVNIRVDVQGIESLGISNDFGLLDATQAFQPFGFNPVVGSNMFIHTPELVRKNIVGTKVVMEWKGLPENFKAYYEGYLGHTNSLVERNEDFKVSLALRKDKEWISIDNQKEPLFELFGDALSFKINWEQNQAPDRRYAQDNGLLKITLQAPKRAFGHSIYPSVYTKAIMAQVQQKDEPIPNPPYTPTLESIRLSYEAQETLDLGKQPNGELQFFRITPFGLDKKTDPQNALSLVSTDYNAGGQLFLGIESLRPPEQLRLFFEIREESVLDTPNIALSYLNADGWKRFSKNQLLSDATQNLRQTGIIIINVPVDAATDNMLMPTGLHWIKLETLTHPDRFDKILAVRTNAILATLNMTSLQTSHPVNKLPPNTITSFVQKKKQVKIINQPYASFGGKLAENHQSYFTRISELLAHKNRGISSWDIEHLVLERFQEVYQVICNPNSNANGDETGGALHIVVIPKIDQNNQNSIRKPLASAALLRRIKTYLQACVSPHIMLSVGNARYDVLQIHAMLSFNDKVDAGYYLKKLGGALKSFLSPWAFDLDQKLEMGTILYRSSLIKFIELQPYVSFIAQIKMYKNNILVETDKIATGKHAILISSDTHVIQTVEPGSVLCQTNQGIAQMIVDINFQVE